MSGMSSTYRQLAMSHIFGYDSASNAMDQPDGLYLSAHTGYPTIANELSGGTYARVVMTFQNVSNGLFSNDSDITLNLTSALITHFAIWDASTGGNLVWIIELSSSFRSSAGSSVTISSGNIKVNLAEA